MRYLDKTFFKFLFVFSFIIVCGLLFISKVGAQTTLININSASLEELQTLDGIGPTYAQRIIDYRTASGPFVQIEDIKNVSGIGDVTFEKMRNQITVGQVTQVESQPISSASAQNVSNQAKQESSSAGPVIQKGIDYKISIEANKSGGVNTPLEFRAKHNIGSKKVGVRWSFGDGSVGYGAYIIHVYKYPGDYVVVASASAIEEKVSARAEVSIVEERLKIVSYNKDKIEVLNEGKTEFDLYGRDLVWGSQVYQFPEDSIIKQNKAIAFSSDVTGLRTEFNTSPMIVISGQSKPNLAELPEVEQFETLSKQDEIIKQIVALKRKQAEIEEKNKNIAQIASPGILMNSEPATPNIAQTKSWIKTIRNFFGFK